MAYVDSDKFVVGSTAPDRAIGHELGDLLIGLGHPTNADNITAVGAATGVDCLSDDQIEEARNDSLAR